MQISKPKMLRRGSRIAILSPSSGAAHRFPHVLDAGLKNLREVFGLQPVEFETCRMPDSDLYANPQKRAEDLNAAFADPTIEGIFATIGGDDSVRILPFLDLEVIRANPKILMGYSDTTTLTTLLNQHGLVTFNGPGVMAGFAQTWHVPDEFTKHVKHILFEADPLTYPSYPSWTDHYLPWSNPDYAGEVADLQSSEGWRWLQGSNIAKGRLFGGCIEVLEFMKGTRFWPSLEFFDRKIMFFETSEDKPTVSQVKYMLRNYGSMGVLERLSAILFGRARSYTPDEKSELDEMVKRVVSFEFGLIELPIVTNMDFGHTDPQFILPLGIEAELDLERKVFRLAESAVH